MSHDDDGHHEHDLGLAHDLPRMVGRRRFMALMGGAGVATASGLPASALEYVALPWETAGPYPADGTNVKNGQTVNALTQSGVIREDLRPSFGEYAGTADGLLLTVELTLENAADRSPLEGYAIYIWHCDATGNYSLYDLTEVNFLRGVGVAGANGVVRFTTIVPGCYDGRWPHIHFEVFESVDAAVGGANSVLTAQVALPEAECAATYAANPVYSNGTRNLGRISIATDMVFRDNSEDEIAQQTLAMVGHAQSGYTGTVTIPIDFDADRSVTMAGGPRGFGGTPPQRG